MSTKLWSILSLLQPRSDHKSKRMTSVLCAVRKSGDIRGWYYSIHSQQGSQWHHQKTIATTTVAKTPPKAIPTNPRAVIIGSTNSSFPTAAFVSTKTMSTTRTTTNRYFDSNHGCYYYDYHCWNQVTRPFATRATTTTTRKSHKSNQQTHASTRTNNPGALEIHDTDLFTNWFNLANQLVQPRPSSRSPNNKPPKPQRLTPRDWSQATKLLSTLRQLTSELVSHHDATAASSSLLSSSSSSSSLSLEQRLVESAFALLDRLCLDLEQRQGEQQQQQKQQSASSSSSSSSSSLLPHGLHLSVLVSVLSVWREYCQRALCSSGGSSSSTRAIANNTELLLLSPKSVFDKVQRCYRTGLIRDPTQPWSFLTAAAPFNIILHTLVQQQHEQHQTAADVLGSWNSLSRRMLESGGGGGGVLGGGDHGGGAGGDLYCTLGEAMLLELLHQARAEPTRYPHPDELTIRNLVELWATPAAGYPQAPQRAEAHLRQLQQWFEQQQQQQQQQPQQHQDTVEILPNVALKPSAPIYCAVMEAYSRGTGGQVSNAQAAMERIQDLYHEMKQNCWSRNDNHDNGVGGNDDDDDVGEKAVVYSRVCHALSNCRCPQAADIARAVLNELIETIEKPQCQTFHDKDDRARRHLTRKEESITAARQRSIQHAFSAVMTAYGRAGRADEAQDVFDLMERLSEQQNQQHGEKRFNVTADAISYNALIWAHAKVGNYQKVEELVTRMVTTTVAAQKRATKANTTNQPAGGVDLFTWNGLLASWAESSDPQTASKHVALILRRLEELMYKEQQQEHHDGAHKGDYNNNDGALSRDSDDNNENERHRVLLPVDMYNILMSCYGRYNNSTGAREALKLFQWMKDQQRRRQHQPQGKEEQRLQGLWQPNGGTYLGLIFAFKNAGDAEQSEYYLRELCHLIQQQQQDRGSATLTSAELLVASTVHFNVAMEAWTKTTKSKKVHPVLIAQKAQAIFDLMPLVQVLPSLINYNTLLWAWARASSFPDATVAGAAMLRCDSDNGGSQAAFDGGELVVERLFRQMQDRRDLEPDVITYNAVFYGQLQSPYPLVHKRAEAQFSKITSEFKTDEMYNTYMMYRLRRREFEKVEDIFQEIMAARKPRLKTNPPAFYHYITRMQAWTRAGNPEMAKTVLQEMIVGYQEGWLKRPPSVKGFNAVLQAWQNSKRPNAASKAEEGLRQMLEQGQGGGNAIIPLPDCHSFTTVISTYAQSNLPDAGDKAWMLLQQHKQFAQAQEAKQNKIRTQTLSPNDSMTMTDHSSLQVQPVLLTYLDVIMALLHSLSRISNHHDGTVRGGSTIIVERVRLLLLELQTKPSSFFRDTQAAFSIRKVRSLLKSLPRGYSHLMAEFIPLESKLEAADQAPGAAAR